jgi:micrococcal nuclease
MHAKLISENRPTLSSLPATRHCCDGMGGGCSGSEAESQPEDQSDSSVSGTSGGDSNLDCAGFETHEQAQRVLKKDPSDPHYLDGDGDSVACEELQP